MGTERPMVPQEPLHYRSSYTKSTKGCNTCKDRHIRCDETKPVCERCSKSRRVCSYAPRPRRYKTRNSGRATQFHYFRLPRLPSSSNVVLPTFSGYDKDLEAFQFFLQQTSPVLDAEHATYSWIEDLLRCQAHDVMVHRSCLAVGALHRSLLDVDRSGWNAVVVGGDRQAPAEVDTMTAASPHLHASRLYGVVLKMLQQAIRSGTANAVALKFTCLLLNLFCSMAGRQTESRVHLAAGLQLLDDMDTSSEDFAVNGMLFSDSFMSESLSGRPSPKFQSLEHITELRGLKPSGASINPYQEAQFALHQIMVHAWVFVARQLVGSPDPAFEREATRAKLLAQLTNWWRSFLAVASNFFIYKEAGVSLLIAQYNVCCAMVSISNHDQASSLPFAELRACHETVVTSIARFTELDLQVGGTPRRVFSFHTGVILMLLFVAGTTDDSYLRQRIVELLHRVPEIEGAWRASAAARLVENLPAGARGVEVIFPMLRMAL